MRAHHCSIAAWLLGMLLLSWTGERARAEDYVDNTSSAGAFPIAADGQVASLQVDPNDFPGVIRAANDLANDIDKVTGKQTEVIHNPAIPKGPAILIGTIGKSVMIDQLIRDQKLDVTAISGKWESFLIQVLSNPAPGIDNALVIAGSDKRGTIYGIYDLSEKMGVSPWYWWADVPVPHSDMVYVRAGRYVQGPPMVKYRGIFINDEEPAFGPWSREKFGGVNSKMYSRMFELILRLKGNYLWPAMWGKSFTEDDPESPRLADEYGIVIGTSHHEPMMRAQQDWTKSHQGPWDYATNQAELQRLWQAGIERNRNYETLTTIGMRGDGDEPMIKGGDMRRNTQLLERIVADQRQIISETLHKDPAQVPQLWALYKEVADYYDHGMRVPDDVTLLWCDDNWGNLRRVPTEDERKRPGGAGIYYHFDYVGGPRSYKWINTNPLPKVWDQMNLAYQYGADRIWIVNVGDLKPMELPIEFFLKLAWDPDAMPSDKIADFTLHWAKREFGPAHANEIAEIMSRYSKYNGWRKPELLDASTFSLVNYEEADRVLDGWRAVAQAADQINTQLPAEARDAFYQLVLYPTQASANLTELYITAGRNRLYARQGRASTNHLADRVTELFKRDQELSDFYNHTMSGGKWNHMMDEVRFGYTSWNTPRRNIMPKVTRINPQKSAAMGVAIDGSESAWPGSEAAAELPEFDSIGQQRSWFDVFNKGQEAFDFKAQTDQPWIQLSAFSGHVTEETRVRVTIDWPHAPMGSSRGTITVSRAGGEPVAIQVNCIRSEQFTRESIGGALGGLSGPISIPAESAYRNIQAGAMHWQRIPDYGRGRSGMEASPVTAKSVISPPQGSPCLEYKLFIAQAGAARVDLITSPTLNYFPGRGLRLAISVDDQIPQTLDAYEMQVDSRVPQRGDSANPSARDWGNWVQDNARTLKSSVNFNSVGIHTLKVWMIDPGVVLEKLIIHHDDLRPSYFGPPEIP